MSKIIPSKYNGNLEVTIRNGVKVLDTDNTNYSYGTVQALWKKILGKMAFENIDKILLLGLGGGSVIDILHHHLDYKGKLTAIEIDPVIIRVARDEFGIKNSSRLDIICDDAFHFAETSRRKYDLILVDIFLDRIMPENALDDSFWQSLRKRLNPGATIIFNAFHYNKRLSSFEKRMNQEGWNLKIRHKVNGTNTMLFLRDKMNP